MTTVHFMIDFEGMTKHVRGLWAEGSYWKCVETLDALGVPMRYWPAVIEGRAKLIQDPDGVKGVDGQLTKDEWQPDLDMCHNGRYPKYEQLSKLFEQQKQWAQNLDQAYLEVCNLWKEYNRTRFNGKRLAEIIRQLQTYPAEVLELAGVDVHELLPHEVDYNPIAGKFEIDVDDYVAHQLELDKAKPPKSGLSKPTGWLLPNGKFYSCDWMDHEWLCNTLKDITRDQAEAAGWIAFTHSVGQPTDFKIIYGNKEPTQRQLDTLFDWQQKYGEAKIINPAGEWR